MFAKFRGRRTTALATTLAVVVGLAITPAFTATAAEGDLVAGAEPIAVVEHAAPLAEAIAPEAAPAPETPVAPEAPVAPVEEPAAAQAEESAPVVEPVDSAALSPILPLGARTAEPGAEEESAGLSPMAAPAAIDFGIQPPTIDALLVGESVEVQFTAPWWGADRWQGTGLPPGLTLSRSGRLTGTVNSAGTYSFVITAQTCFFGCSALTSRIYTVTVTNPAPVIGTINLANATVGSEYSGQLTATGVGTMSYRTSQGSSLPAGLTLSPTGRISGTPTFVPGYDGSDRIDFSVIANNGSDSAAKQLSITVRTPGPKFGNAPLATATVGVPYRQELPLTTGYGTLTYSLLSGSLPDGLTLGSDGAITGTPAYAATYSPTQVFKFGARLTTPSGITQQQFELTLNVTGPTITTATLPEAWLTNPYSQAITTTGSGVVLSAAALPTGLEIVRTGTGYSIAGVPQASGSFTVVLTATNAGGTASVALTLTVNAAPEITTDAVPVATVGSAYSTFIKATGKDVTFTATSAARDVQISAAGELTWTPSGQRSVSVNVTATNNSGSHTKTFQLDSYALPTIATTALGFGVVGETFAPTVDFTGRSAAVTVTQGTLPTGLSMFKTGKFKGQPTTTGTFSFEVTVTNPVGSASRSFEVTIYDIPVIHTQKLDRATVGDTYRDAVWFTGLDAQAKVISGALPTGLTLDAGGTIAGTPTEEGIFRFGMQVANAAGSVTRHYSIRSFQTPEITSTDVDSAVTGIDYRDRIRATGDNAVFTVIRGALPDGLTLNRNGVLKGTATESGTFTFTVRAKNPAGADRQQFTIMVTAPAVQLSVSSIVRGDSMTVSGSGFLPGDQLELWLHSTPALLGTATATGGVFTSTVLIPANIPAGQHSIVVVGAHSGTYSVPLTIALPATPVTPVAPETPVVPVTPGEPTTPVVPVTPADPATPVVPVTPADPATPVEQATPVQPAAPAVQTSPVAPAAPQANSQPRASQQAAVESDESTAPDTEIAEVEAPIEKGAEAELETLDQPVAEGETTPAAAMDWTGLIVGAFGLLLAALLPLLLLWRRRAQKS
jgi:hypothetical protein